METTDEKRIMIQVLELRFLFKGAKELTISGAKECPAQFLVSQQKFRHNQGESSDNKISTRHLWPPTPSHCPCTVNSAENSDSKRKPIHWIALTKSKEYNIPIFVQAEKGIQYKVGIQKMQDKNSRTTDR